MIDFKFQPGPQTATVFDPIVDLKRHRQYGLAIYE